MVEEEKDGSTNRFFVKFHFEDEAGDDNAIRSSVMKMRFRMAS